MREFRPGNWQYTIFSNSLYMINFFGYTQLVSDDFLNMTFSELAQRLETMVKAHGKTCNSVKYP